MGVSGLLSCFRFSPSAVGNCPRWPASSSRTTFGAGELDDIPEDDAAPLAKRSSGEAGEEGPGSCAEAEEASGAGAARASRPGGLLGQGPHASWW